MIKVKSPLRYPGGKSKAIRKILPLIPTHYDEFREPMVGGGSVFLSAKQALNNNAKYVIGDFNYDLCCFWKCVRDNVDGLVSKVQEIKNTHLDGRELFNALTSNNDNLSDIDLAVRFFVLNRITFSGVISGGYSEQSFDGRFTQSSINRLTYASRILQGVEINCGDYTDSLFDNMDNVFIFLDPPYWKNVKSRLYSGEFFNHEGFAGNMKRCNHRWLITLDDSPEVREMFSFANIQSYDLQYSMNTVTKGKEIFITNYDIAEVIPISKKD